jgi:hypothetical protein
MRLSNKSSRSSADLVPLINFVRQYTKCSSHVKVTIHDWTPEIKVDGDTTKLREPEMIQVRVFVGKTDTYPYKTRLMPETPVVRYRDWKDHFVVTLAHELQHAWQFENQEESGWAVYRRAVASPTFKAVTKFDTKDFEKKAEIDAETFGAKVLEAYQRAFPIAY